VAASKEADAEEPEVDLHGQLKVPLDGAEYTLRPSRQALTNIEVQTGKPLLMLAAQTSAMMLPLSEIGVCISEMMHAYAAFDPSASADYKSAKPERCADLVYEGDPLGMQNRLSKIFKNALDGGYTAAGEPKAAGTKMTTEPTLTAA
jgi:hypothetical protein